MSYDQACSAEYGGAAEPVTMVTTLGDFLAMHYQRAEDGPFVTAVAAAALAVRGIFDAICDATRAAVNSAAEGPVAATYVAARGIAALPGVVTRR